MTSPQGDPDPIRSGVVADELAILDQGVDAWNDWRAADPTGRPSLAGADLSGRSLRGVNFSGTNLHSADLDGADLANANMKMAVLTRADLAGANLAGADLYKASLLEIFGVDADFSDAYLAEAELISADLRSARLGSANLTKADLSDANLMGADLSGTDLSEADIRGANLCEVNIAEARLHAVRYDTFIKMGGHFFGIRGLESCYGNALFVRDAKDQDYLDTLKRSIDQTPSPRLRRAKQLAFAAWSIIDFGRSLAKPAAYALVLALTFGVVYSFDKAFAWGLIDYSSSAESPISPFYYSVVTYTTLGFGDITPKNWLGEVVVVAEVVMGYTTLGLLLSILANRVARQS